MSTPQCDATPLERAKAVLAVINECMAARAAETPQRGWQTPRDLAVEFRRQLQAQPELVGWAICATLVRAVYPDFCKAQGYRQSGASLQGFCPATRPADAAKACRHRQGGRRTVTVYRVLDTKVALGELAADERNQVQ